MSPPSYADLGKAARDVFGKGYHFGTVKLDCKSKTEGGVEVNTGGTHTLESGKVAGNLETKYSCKEYGVTATEKWTTDNVLSTDIAVENKIANGLKTTLSGSFAPNTGKTKAVLKNNYKCDFTNINADTTLDVAGPMVSGAVVGGFKDWLFGYQMAFDSQKSKLTKNNFAVGLVHKDLTLHTYANDGAEFGGSVYNKVSPKLEGAVTMGWSGTSNATNFAVGCKYALSKEASVRCKVNNASQVGLSYQQKLNEGVTLTLSSQIEAGKNFAQGGHKIGMALEFSS